MRPGPIVGVALAVVVASCGGGTSGTTSTTGASSSTVVVTTTAPTTTLPATAAATTTTTTTVPASGNPWNVLLGEVSSPIGWTVEPCPGDAPYLCIGHDGLTSRIEIETTALEASGFGELLEAAGAPPVATDLGDAAAHPAIMRALRTLAEQSHARYFEAVQQAFPDATSTFEAPVVAPFGRLNGIRFGSRVEDTTGGVIAWLIRHVAFDGEALWQVTAEFDSRPDEGSFDLGTLLDLDPHITLMMRGLAVGPALPGTDVTGLDLPQVSRLTDAWRQALFVSYGEAEEQLGTTPGGEGGQWMLGPEFGAQGPDGTWWFVDAAKQRLAHYSSDGTFLDSAAVPAEFLIGGELFPWRLPHVLDDGTVVTIALEPGDTRLLLWLDGHFETRRLGESINVKLDDGVSLYGLTSAGDIARIDPLAGAVEIVGWFVTRAGTRFNLWVAANVVTLWLPDAPRPNIRQLELTYGLDRTDRVYVSVEAAVDADGALVLYLLGGTDSGEGGQLGGFVTISPDGSVSPIETTAGPDVATDPGSPAHLGTSPVTGRPWLVFVEPDGVHAFERVG